MHLLQADSLNATEWIVDHIVENGGYCLIPVKDNKPWLKRLIVITPLEKYEETDKFHHGFILDYGVLVDRRITTTNDTGSLKLRSYSSG